LRDILVFATQEKQFIKLHKTAVTPTKKKENAFSPKQND